MIVCPNCGKELEEGTQFCDNCGTKIVETIFCPNCGEQTSTEFPYCQKCGAALQEVPEEKKDGSPLKNLLKNKAVLFGGVGVIAVLVIILIVSLVGRGGGGGSKNSSSKANYSLYIKDGEISYTKFSKDGSMEITSRLDNDNNYSDYGLSNLAGTLGPYVVLCSDGKTMFYPDRIEDGGFSLYYRNISKAGEEPTRVDTNVSTYYVTDKGDQVFYLKDGALYQNDLKEKNKVANDVRNFAVSADAKKVLYRDDDGNLYIWTGSSDKEKISSGVDTISKYNDDLSVIYYMKEDSLYKYEKGENQKIASDVFRLIRVFDSGEAYYVKSDDEEIKLMDYVNDDMSDDDYYANSMREYLKNETINHTVYTLYYYDGSDSTKVSDSLSGVSNAAASERAVIAVSVYDSSEVGKIRLSEVQYAYEVWEKVNDALYTDREYNIVVKDDMTSFDQNKISNLVISKDGSTVLFLDDVSSDGEEADLYQISIKGDEVGKPSLYDTDVSTARYGILSDGSLYYFKDVKDSEGELYIDKAAIDFDVYCYNVSTSYYEDSKLIFYYVDYSADKGGTLKMYKGGSSTKIADDVVDFVVVNGDDVLYLYDFSTKHYTGTLYLHDGKTATKIDDDVSGIIRICDAETRRNSFAR